MSSNHSLLSIHGTGRGTCVWCLREDAEGVDARFRDGLAGFFCWTDLRRALRVRGDRQRERFEQAPAAGAEASR